MSIFSLRSEFEITVKHPKEEAFGRFHSYVKKNRNLNLTDFEKCNIITFTKGMSLLSLPIDFEINFKEDGENQTVLTVKSSSGTIDWGKAKGIINDIVKEIY